MATNDLPGVAARVAETERRLGLIEERLAEIERKQQEVPTPPPNGSAAGLWAAVTALSSRLYVLEQARARVRRWSTRAR